MDGEPANKIFYGIFQCILNMMIFNYNIINSNLISYYNYQYLPYFDVNYIKELFFVNINLIVLFNSSFNLLLYFLNILITLYCYKYYSNLLRKLYDTICKFTKINIFFTIANVFIKNTYNLYNEINFIYKQQHTIK